MEESLHGLCETYIEFDYVNWEGLFSRRKAKVLGVYFGSTEFHPGKQWLMKAMDLDKKAERTFSAKEMQNVTVFTTADFSQPVLDREKENFFSVEYEIPPLRAIYWEGIRGKDEEAIRTLFHKNHPTAKIRKLGVVQL